MVHTIFHKLIGNRSWSMARPNHPRIYYEAQDRNGLPTSSTRSEDVVLPAPDTNAPTGCPFSRYGQHQEMYLHLRRRL